MMQQAGRKRPFSPGFPAESGKPAGRARAAAIALGLMAAAALTVAGCGTAPQPSPPGHGHAVTTARPGPRARAESYARRALRDLRLPRGLRRIPFPARPPSGLRYAGLPGAPRHTVVDVRELYRTGSPAGTVNGFLARHVPAGWSPLNSGTSDLSGGPASYLRDISPVRPPAWAYNITVATAVVAARGGGSLLRVDAQVAWYPPRSAAEHIDPARYRAVIVIEPKPGTIKPLRLSRTFTGRRTVARLAALVNGLPATPDIAVPCPLMIAGRFSRLVFLPRAGAQEIVVTMPGCISATVRVGGRPQPALYPSGPLSALMSRLLGLA